MITAIVQFRLPSPLPRDKARKLFLDSAPKYREMQGLIRKYYLLSTDGLLSGGVYLFDSRKDAEHLFTNEWKEYIVNKYGSEPSVAYFESPVIVDNLVGKILENR
jgi:hypothetical protein